jgi:signal transduction histidine kinase
MSLRFRLFLSHAAVALSSLVVLALAITLLLSEFQRELALRELSVLAGNLWRQARTAAVQNASDLPQQFQERVSRIISRDNNLRVLLIDENGIISSDSITQLNMNMAGSRLDINTKPDFLNFNRDIASAGEFRDKTSFQRRWVYVVYPVEPLLSNPPARQSGYVALARQLPQRIIPARLNLYIDEDSLAPILQATIATWIFAGIIAALVARSIAKPIQKVTAGANAIADGEYHQRVDASGPYEVKRLATDFNRMAERVQESQRIERDLLINVSHELKTPLTSIKGFAQAIMDGTVNDKDTTQHVAQVIFDESERLSRLVNSLLDSTRIETGNAPMNIQTVDMNEIVRMSLTKFELRAKEAKLIMTAHYGAVPTIQADGDRLAQVMTNLIDNAIKHTPQNGKIIIRTSTVPNCNNKIEVSVHDNGNGIPSKDLPRIFDRFYQVDKSRVAGANGNGLGLAISKQIIEAHGGQIGVNSVESEGTTIWFRLTATA